MNLRIADEINLPNYRGGGGGGANPGVASATLVLCPAGMKPSGLIPPNIRQNLKNSLYQNVYIYVMNVS